QPAAGTPVKRGDGVVLNFGPGGPVTVPNVQGLSLALARQRLQAAGLGMRSAGGSGGGVVTSQSPGAGTRATRGSEVTVTNGPRAGTRQPLRAPNVFGMSA